MVFESYLGKDGTNTRGPWRLGRYSSRRILRKEGIKEGRRKGRSEEGRNEGKKKEGRREVGREEGGKEGNKTVISQSLPAVW